MIWNFEIYEIPIIDIAKYEAGNATIQSIMSSAIVACFSHCIDERLVKEQMLCSAPEKTRALNKTAYDLEVKKYVRENFAQRTNR